MKTWSRAADDNGVLKVSGRLEPAGLKGSNKNNKNRKTPIGS